MIKAITLKQPIHAFDCVFSKINLSNYQDNERLAIIIEGVDEDEEFIDEVISVNLPNQLLIDEDCFFADIHNIPQSLFDELETQELIEFTPYRGQSGYNTYPVYRLLY